MRRTAKSPLLFAFLFLFSLTACGKKTAISDPAVEAIRSKLSSTRTHDKISIRADSLYSLESVRHFYEMRQFRSAWSVEKNLLPDADSLVAAINKSDDEGLNPIDYHLRAIDSALMEMKQSYTGREPIDPRFRADVDLLLTDAYLLYASHLAGGKIDRDSLKVRWDVGPKGEPYDSLLAATLDSHTICAGLQSLAPHHSMYTGLKEMLVSLRAVAEKGRWGTVPPGEVMKGGDAGKRVLALRIRLWASGDLRARSGWSSDEFDSTLVDGLRLFQQRQGLEPSGVADSATIATLNIPVQRRLDQIRINLERWRWMPHDLGRRHIIVNIPDFQLIAEDEGKTVVRMKVVLGQPDWPTPVFSSAISQVLFNVHWIAPDDILSKELFNYMKADSNYLRGNNMTLWRKTGDSLTQIEPKSINLKEMDPEDIDFLLRQEGGPQNIMGQVKFLLPNKFSVYLHDTPYREDFPKSVRMFSHGCIRLEKPLDLAEFVLREFPTWNRERIDTVVAQTKELSLSLRHPIPVHVVYCTAWRGMDGSPHFRQDYYGLDKKLGAVLLARR